MLQAGCPSRHRWPDCIRMSCLPSDDSQMMIQHVVLCECACSAELHVSTMESNQIHKVFPESMLSRLTCAHRDRSARLQPAPTRSPHCRLASNDTFEISKFWMWHSHSCRLCVQLGLSSLHLVGYATCGLRWCAGCAVLAVGIVWRLRELRVNGSVCGVCEPWSVTVRCCPAVETGVG